MTDTTPIKPIAHELVHIYFTLVECPYPDDMEVVFAVEDSDAVLIHLPPSSLQMTRRGEFYAEKMAAARRFFSEDPEIDAMSWETDLPQVVHVPEYPATNAAADTRKFFMLRNGDLKQAFPRQEVLGEDDDVRSFKFAARRENVPALLDADAGVVFCFILTVGGYCFTSEEFTEKQLLDVLAKAEARDRGACLQHGVDFDYADENVTDEDEDDEL